MNMGIIANILAILGMLALAVVAVFIAGSILALFGIVLGILYSAVTAIA